MGKTSFLLLLSLAITSNDKMIHLLRNRRWSQLHRLAYVAAVGGVAHFFMLGKTDTRLLLTFAGVLGILLGYRVLNEFFPHYTERALARSSANAGSTSGR